MNCKWIGLFLLMIQFLCLSYISGQNLLPDNVMLESARHSVTGLYEKNASNHLGIYTGADYQFEHTNIGNTLFHDPHFIIGDVIYDNIRYVDIPMVYDLVKDELVVQNPEKLNNIAIQSDRISRFWLQGCCFVRISPDTVTGPNVSSGFYRCLYDGRTRVFTRSMKFIEEYAEDGKMKKMVREKDVWYINKGGKLFEVNNKRSVLMILEDRNKELRLFCRKNHLKFRTPMDISLIKLAEYYDQITGK
ncbi:MAG: hypothetical protein HXX13_00275 [Bacteroidetes bacterium]|nr:hypothetical protein [Bacteroidota bacterium]